MDFGSQAATGFLVFTRRQISCPILYVFQVNGRLVRLPYRISQAISVSETQDGILINQDSQVQVHLRSDGEVTVGVKKTLAGKLCAPCGNFNGNSSDDLKLPNGMVETNIAELLHAWEAKDF